MTTTGTTTDPGTTAPALCYRRAEVRDIRRLSPRTLRVTFGGPDLVDVERVAPDGYLKVFFPRVGQVAPELPAMPAGGDVGTWYRAYLAMPDGVRPPMRTYTLRDRRAGEDGVELDVDFVLHDEGPARDWALRATVGDRVAFTGPYGLYAPRPEHDWQLLVGDETAVPALGAIVEALPRGARAVVVAEVRDAGERVTWRTAGDVEITWLQRDRADDLVGTLAALELPRGRPYVWLAGEAGVVRDLRRHLTRERGVDTRDVCFTGYWRRGRTEDQAVADAMAGDDPTAG